MPTTADNIPTSERAARLQGCPYLVGNNVLERYNVLPQWRVSGAWDSGTDISDNTNYPVWHAWDRSGDAVTRPTSAAQNQTECSFIMDLNPGTTTTLGEVDTFVVIGHNFHTWDPATTEVYLDLDLGDGDLPPAPVPDFSGNVTGAFWDMADWDDGRRLISQEVGLLGADSRFSTIRYARLRIVRTSGNFGSVVPEFSELWLGRRRQMSYFPNVPFDNRAGQSDRVDHHAEGGHVTTYFKTSKQAILNMTVRSGGADMNGHDQNDALQNWWWTESEGGKPSLLVLNTSTDLLAEPYIVLPSSDFSLPVVGAPFERQGQLTFEEIAPFYRAEVDI